MANLKDLIVSGPIRAISGVIGDLTGNASSATVASKLGTADVGSATKGIYLDDGVAKACTYTVAKSVPSDAVFTDTVYTHPTTSGNKHIPSGGSSGQILKWSADGTAAWAAEYSYTHPTTSGNKHIPSGGSANQVLVYSADGTAAWGAVPSHTHSGYLTAHQTIKQDGITGATINRIVECSIAAATAAKTGSINTGTFSLEKGVSVKVKFANANTADTPTLNINSTGAKNIFHKGAQITTGGNKALLAGICEFVYDGTQWHLVGNYIDTNTTYTHPTTSGNKHIPSGGASGNILGWDSDGTAKWISPSDNDTKNTTGSTDTSSKIFLVGATSQAANPQTYSHDTVFVDTDGALNTVTAAKGNSSTKAATTAFVATAIGDYVKKAGDTMTGALNFANATWNKMGDDAYIGDNNVGGHICIKPGTSTYDNYGGISFHNSSNTALVQLNASSGALTSSGSIGVSNNAAKMQYNSTTQAIEFIFA